MSGEEEEKLRQVLRGEREADIAWRDPEPPTLATRTEVEERGRAIHDALERMRVAGDVREDWL